jgi:hypothetical protein
MFHVYNTHPLRFKKLICSFWLKYKPEIDDKSELFGVIRVNKELDND